ncbi:hypothetical protein, partial [Polaromonas sp.]|uniref:hypothetical protein n=1 Tax=Polaromonas sp. TaxID=1869339 RepID=UPI0027300505
MKPGSVFGCDGMQSLLATAVQVGLVEAFFDPAFVDRQQAGGCPAASNFLLRRCMDRRHGKQVCEDIGNTSCLRSTQGEAHALAT